jgi:hypothetical protein
VRVSFEKAVRKKEEAVLRYLPAYRSALLVALFVASCLIIISKDACPDDERLTDRVYRCSKRYRIATLPRSLSVILP